MAATAWPDAGPRLPRRAPSPRRASPPRRAPSPRWARPPRLVQACAAANSVPTSSSPAAAASVPPAVAAFIAPSIAPSIATPGRKPRSRSSWAAAMQLTAAARRVPAKFIQPTSTSSGMKQRSSRCRSGRLPGRMSNAVAAGIASTTARVATISCHTPCCGRFAPNSDIAGQSDSDTTARRAAAPVAGSARPPAALAPISTASARQAATDQKAAGTAVEPRTRKTPHADTAAARPAATQAAV